MKKIVYPMLAGSVFAATLSGCAAPDLASAPMISASERQVAQTIAAKTEANCVRMGLLDHTNEKSESRPVGKLVSSVQVRRLFVSPDANWYRAKILSSGTWDNVYFNQRNGAFVCGEKGWQEFSDSSAHSFREIGVPTKTLPK